MANQTCSKPKHLLVLSLVVASLMAPTALALEAPFTDVSEGNSHFVSISYLKSHGFIAGYDDGTFKPDQDINRVEALKMLMQAIKGPQTHNAEPMNFEDVNTNDWFYDSVLLAWENYLVKGYPDGLFHPEKNINLAESLKIVLSQEGKTIPQTVEKKPYNDVPVNEWYAGYAAVSKDRTLFLESRTGGNLNAGEIMDRGWFAELLYRTIKSADGTRYARATWYADYSASTQTASGERLDNEQFTTAHKTLPFGTKLLVTNLSNGKSVEVRVNDRGPYSTGVDLDLSKSAFAAIASIGAGIITTEYSIMSDTPVTPVPPETQQTNTTVQLTDTTIGTTQETTTSTTSDQLPPPIDEYAF